MKKVLGVFFLALFFIPASGIIHAQDFGTVLQTPNDTTSSVTSTSVDTSTSSDAIQGGPVGFFQRLINSLVNENQNSDISAGTALKNKFSFWQKRIEDILNRLNNTF